MSYANLLGPISDLSEVLVDLNHISPWWQRVRDACSQSEQNCAAYITGLVCRKVASDFITSQTEAKVWGCGGVAWVYSDGWDGGGEERRVVFFFKDLVLAVVVLK